MGRRSGAGRSILSGERVPASGTGPPHHGMRRRSARGRAGHHGRVPRTPPASRLRELLADRRVRFLLVGGVNTVFAFVLFAGLEATAGRALDRAGNPVAGSLVPLLGSYAVAILVAFALYRRLVYRVHGHVLGDLGRFVSVYVVSITLNAVLLPLLVAVGVPRLGAQALLVVLITVVSYVGHGRFSFRRASPGEGEPSPEPEGAGPAAPR
jgi:putative flippase GtrA